MAKKEVKKVVKEEKIKETSEEPEEKKMTSEDMERYTKIFVYIIVGFIILAILAFVVFKTPNKFAYQGIDFTKTKEGDIKFYVANIPLVDSSGNQVAEMTIDFRNDPRTLKDIPINSPSKINFLLDKKLYVSLNSPLTKCDDNGLALVNFGRFLSTIGHDIKSATANESQATEDFPYITCENSPSNSVIILQNGLENNIEKISDNCYKITTKDCDILRVLEKFELQIIQEAGSY